MRRAVRGGVLQAVGWDAALDEVADRFAATVLQQRAEFVVAQEAYAHTATVAYADVLLPATSWGEKSGTVTNSERRISRVRAVLPTPG